jgi:hypothetical protein
MLSGYEANQRLKARMKCMFDAEYGMSCCRKQDFDAIYEMPCCRQVFQVREAQQANLFKQLTHRFRDWKVPKDPSGYATKFSLAYFLTQVDTSRFSKGQSRVAVRQGAESTNFL